MASANPFASCGDDRRQATGGPPRRQGAPQFVWSVSSPSPADVAELELLFPSVIQLQSESMDREINEWLAGGLIIRSLFRWVPPEAVIREFRRAGIAGGISSISLSHRFALLKFEDPVARDTVLLQPWVVNGQPLAAEPWRPDFVPVDEALTSALLWIRLPDLPIEYWSEEALRSILAVAGDFISLDSSTIGRRRGSFARAAVRVDLSRPLRPGARIRGTGSPFWQSFTYEHIEGVCPRCGSIHLGGLCSSPSSQSSSPVSPRFGPWMTATRQRRSPTTATPNSGNSVSPADAEGWTTPRKTARRRGGPSPSSLSPLLHSVPVTVATVTDTLKEGANVQPNSTNSAPILQLTGKKKKEGPGPKFKFSAKASASIQNNPGVIDQPLTASTETVQQKVNSVNSVTESGSKPGPSSKVATNPFSLRGSDRWAGVPTIREDANPNSTKRARPAEVIPPRAIPKASKAKGKGRAGSTQKGTIASNLLPRDSCDHDAAVSILKQALLPLPQRPVDMELSQLPISSDLGSVSLPSASTQGDVAVTDSVGDHSDIDMMGSQSGGQDKPQSSQ